MIFPAVKDNIEKVETYPRRSVDRIGLHSGLLVVLLLEFNKGFLH